jgi:hypothetical protein
MFTKTDATSLAAVAGTDVATCSLKLMLHPYSCCFRDRGCYMVTKTESASPATVPETEGATCSCASTESYIPSCCFRDKGCYMFT